MLKKRSFLGHFFTFPKNFMRSLKIFKKNVGVFYLRINGFGEKRRRFIKLVNTNLE